MYLGSLSLVPEIVSVNCHLNRIWNHLGDGLLGCHLDLVEVRRSSHGGWHHSLGRTSRAELSKNRELKLSISKHAYVSLSQIMILDVIWDQLLPL